MLERVVAHLHIHILVLVILSAPTCRILVSNAASLPTKISTPPLSPSAESTPTPSKHQQINPNSNSHSNSVSPETLDTNYRLANVIESEHYIHIFANDCLVVEHTINKLGQLLEHAYPSPSSLKVHVIRTLNTQNVSSSNLPPPTCLINVDLDKKPKEESTYGFNFVILVKLLRFVSLNYDNWLVDYDSEHDDRAAALATTNLVSNLNFRCQGRADSDDDYPYARHATLRMDRATNALVKAMYGSLMTNDLSGCESTNDENESDRLDIG